MDQKPENGASNPTAVKSPVKRKFSDAPGHPSTEDGLRVSSPPYLRRRMDTITGELGKEGGPLPQPGLHSGKCIGVFTSGGDSQGKFHCKHHSVQTSQTAIIYISKVFKNNSFLRYK